jgi:hypothetical protein
VRLIRNSTSNIAEPIAQLNAELSACATSPFLDTSEFLTPASDDDLNEDLVQIALPL